MQRRKKTSFRTQLGHILVSVLVMSLVAVPAYLTGEWIRGVIFGNDPRKASAIAAMQQRAIDTTSGELKPFEQPIISVTFDDGWESNYTIALPMLQRYGISTTQYLLSGVFENTAYLSEAQVHAMQKAGHEIGSHTVHHLNLTELDDMELERELRESKADLEKRFGPVKDFASPFGAYDARTLAAIKKLYRSHRNTVADPLTVDDKDVNTPASLSRYNITAYTVRATTTERDLQQLIDYTIKHKGWLVLTYHQVGGDVISEGETYGVTPDQLEKQLRQISNSKARAVPVGKVLDALERR